MAKLKLPESEASLVKKSNLIFDTKQINAFWQRTPEKFTYERPGRAGQVWKYVPGYWVKAQLDRVFGYNWSFEIKQIETKGSQVIAHGRLTANVPIPSEEGLKFHQIFKEDMGRADIKLRKDGKPLDIGNDYKAATTDALKRCASQFGIARDVYSAYEMREIEFEESPEVQKQEEQIEKAGEEAEARLKEIE